MENKKKLKKYKHNITKKRNVDAIQGKQRDKDMQTM